MASEIKVLGPGCPRCQQTEQVVKEAVAQSGLPVKVVKVSGMMEIAAHGVMSTPAVVVDGHVMASGRVPSKQEILGWLSA